MIYSGWPIGGEAPSDRFGRDVAWIGTHPAESGDDERMSLSDFCPNCGHPRRFHAGDISECLVAGCDCEHFGMANAVNIPEDDWTLEDEE